MRWDSRHAATASTEDTSGSARSRSRTTRTATGVPHDTYAISSANALVAPTRWAMWGAACQTGKSFHVEP